MSTTKKAMKRRASAEMRWLSSCGTYRICEYKKPSGFPYLIERISQDSLGRAVWIKMSSLSQVTTNDTASRILRDLFEVVIETSPWKEDE